MYHCMYKVVFMSAGDLNNMFTTVKVQTKGISVRLYVIISLFFPF